MLQLYGRNNSSNVQTVLITLHELNIAFTRHDVGGQFGQNNTETYLRRNPNGLIPLLEDGDVDVWESNTIVRYLTQKFGPTPLYPTELVARSHVERWMDWRQTAFGPAIGLVFFGYVRTALEKRDMTLIRAKEAESIRAVSMLNAQLATNEFVAGDTFTAADIALTMFVHRYFSLPFETPRPDLPHLARWMASVRARDSVRPYTEMVLT